jgi:hypothetical protein
MFFDGFAGEFVLWLMLTIVAYLVTGFLGCVYSLLSKYEPYVAIANKEVGRLGTHPVKPRWAIFLAYYSLPIVYLTALLVFLCSFFSKSLSRRIESFLATRLR